MPTEPPDPGVTAFFLELMRRCRWGVETNHLVGPTGARAWLHVRDDVWTVNDVASDAFDIERSTLDILLAASPADDGAFQSGGRVYTLRRSGRIAVQAPVA